MIEPMEMIFAIEKGQHWRQREDRQLLHAGQRRWVAVPSLAKLEQLDGPCVDRMLLDDGQLQLTFVKEETVITVLTYKGPAPK